MPFRHDPSYWRERAEQTRALAEGMKDREAKQITLHIAEDYDKLASRADRSAQTPDRQNTG
jgi:hypothetical protein